MNEGKMIGTFF